MWPTATFYSWVGKRRRKLHDSVDVVDCTDRMEKRPELQSSTTFYGDLWLGSEWMKGRPELRFRNYTNLHVDDPIDSVASKAWLGGFQRSGGISEMKAKSSYIDAANKVCSLNSAYQTITWSPTTFTARIISTLIQNVTTLCLWRMTFTNKRALTKAKIV